MALTRARVVAGDDAWPLKSQRRAREFCAGRRHPNCARMFSTCAASWRRKRVSSDLLDLKYAAGGQIDLEFLAQYLSLSFAHEAPALLATAPADIIARAGALGFLPSGNSESLLAAYRLYTQTAQVLHTILEAGVPLSQSSAPVKQRLAAAAGLPSFAQLEAELRQTEAQVRAIFREIIG